MKTDRRTEIVRHLSEGQLDAAIDEAQKADETRLVRRLCFIKNVYLGDTNKMAARRVGVSRPTGGRWLIYWSHILRLFVTASSTSTAGAWREE